ncbi:MAG: hypothetical protein PF485_10250 [Bacteroidales bacterium]|jgi:hypothetical protein|nr:hypothetical protein [Bacteroidales bacterium]
MKKLFLIVLIVLIVLSVSKAQYIYPVADYKSEMKDVELSNFDINGDILYLPLGKTGLHILNIQDLNNIHELSIYTEYEKRSRKKVHGYANCVKVSNNKAYLSYGPLGLKILDVSDPTMPFVLGTYYRYQDVYCTEIYENYAFLGYTEMGLEVVDLKDLDNINIVSRNNIRDFSVNNIEIIPPYVIISGGDKGLHIFKFTEPFTSFKQAEFPRSHFMDNKANELLIRGSTAYVANDIGGLSVLNVGLPLYPLEVKTVKTESKATDLYIDRNYMYVTCGKYIEVFDIREPENPVKISEYFDKEKEFKYLKIHNNHLYALYKDGNKNYGIVIFQVE